MREKIISPFSISVSFGIGTTIRIGREIPFLLYAFFLQAFYCLHFNIYLMQKISRLKIQHEQRFKFFRLPTLIYTLYLCQLKGKVPWIFLSFSISMHIVSIFMYTQWFKRKVLRATRKSMPQFQGPIFWKPKCYLNKRFDWEHNLEWKYFMQRYHCRLLRLTYPPPVWTFSVFSQFGTVGNTFCPTFLGN